MSRRRAKALWRPDENFGVATLDLYEHQKHGIELLTAGFLAGHDKQIACGPTGSGKTEMAASLITGAQARGTRVVFVADRIVLVDQASERLNRYGIRHGVVQGSNSRYEDEQVLVCSAQTIEARDLIYDVDLLIVDECHTRRRWMLDFMSNWPGPTVGLSATPLSRGLGRVYSKVHNVITTNALLEREILSPLRVFEMHEIDMTDEPVGSWGEWTATQVKRRSRELIGEMVVQWQRMTELHFGGPVQTLVFSADVEDGELICKEFQSAGFDFRQATHYDSYDETVDLIEGFSDEQYVGLVSVEKLAKGFDVPSVRCIIGARPYSKSLMSFLQQIGRGMRRASGKEYCLYLDFAGNFAGWYDSVMDYWEFGVSSLNQREMLQPRRSEGVERVAPVCSCGVVVSRKDEVCPGCGRRIMRPTADQRRLQRSRMEELAVAPGSRKWMQNREWTWAQICRVGSQIYSTVDFERSRRFAIAQYMNLYDDGKYPSRRFALDFLPADSRVERRVYRQLQEYRKKQGAA